MSRRRAVRRRLVRLTAAPAAVRPPWPIRAAAAPLPVLLGAVGIAAALVAAVAGIVAGLVVGWYALLGLRALRRSAADRSVVVARTAALDLIGGLAADLRAGAAAAPAVDAARAALAGTDPAIARTAARLDAACTVSDRLGAPLADLLDRVESDLRGVERVRAAVAAQTTGARASAGLLALLPLAGIGLGYAMGARPGYVLLHTPIGVSCAFGAIVLQFGGLSWTGRLCRNAVEQAS